MTIQTENDVSEIKDHIRKIYSAINALAERQDCLEAAVTAQGPGMNNAAIEGDDVEVETSRAARNGKIRKAR